MVRPTVFAVDVTKDIPYPRKLAFGPFKPVRYELRMDRKDFKIVYDTLLMKTI